MCGRPQFRLSAPGSVLSARELPEPHGPGDPYLLAAIGCLSQFPKLLERVAPSDQTFDAANGYTGMFRWVLLGFWRDHLFISRSHDSDWVEAANQSAVALSSSSFIIGDYYWMVIGDRGHYYRDLT